MANKYVSRFEMPDGEYVYVKDAEGRNISNQNYEQLNERDTELNNAIEANSELISSLRNSTDLSLRKFIFFGDSYNTGWSPDGTYTPWGRVVANQLGKTIDTDAFIVADSGGAFGRPDTDPQSFYASLKAYGDTKTVAFRHSITDIVIAAGANEYLYEFADVRNGMLRLGNYIKAYFPNAQVWLFATGWNPYPVRRQKIADVYAVSYSFGSYYNKWKYHEIYPQLHDRSHMSSDLIHPNASGQNAIGNAIALTILGGTPSMDSISSPIMSGQTQIGQARRIGKFVVVEFKMSALSVANVSPTAITKTSLPLTCNYFFGGYSTDQNGMNINGVLRAASKFYNTTFTFKPVYVSDNDLSSVIGLCTNAVNETHSDFIPASDVEGIQFKESVCTIDICKI